MTTTTEHLQAARRVSVWFGQHAIVDHVAEAAVAAHFEAAMRRRFTSLRITNEPTVAAVVPDADDR